MDKDFTEINKRIKSLHLKEKTEDLIDSIDKLTIEVRRLVKEIGSPDKQKEVRPQNRTESVLTTSEMIELLRNIDKRNYLAARTARSVGHL